MKSHPGKTASEVRRNLTRYKVLAADVQKAAERCGYGFAATPAPQPDASQVAPIPLKGGIPLEGKRLMPRKPSDSAKIHIHRLPKDKAFPVDELANRLAVSETTLKKHAKDLGCLLFIEVSPDDWRHVILNPETAAQHTPTI